MSLSTVKLTLNHKIIKSCGAFCRIDDANVSNLILIIRPTALCDNLAHLRHYQQFAVFVV